MVKVTLHFYGENGSGKSSIYEGIKTIFLSTVHNTQPVIPARHLMYLNQEQ
jgi:AAA15 family ATPase/GTPase